MSANLGKVFQAMADATRRRILDMLREGDLSAGEIAEQFQMTKPAISHHLSVLKEADLAAERRDGQHVIYSLREDSVLEAWDGFMANLCRARVARRQVQKDKRTESRKKKGDAT